jgi:subtilisin family serine protease
VNGRALKRSIARLFIILVGASSLSGVDLSPDHRKIEPLALATDDPPVVAAQRKMMEAPGRPELPVPVFIHMKSDDPDLPARLADLGGSGRRITSRLFTARIPRDSARYISNWPQVDYIESAKRARPLLDVSRPVVSADFVQTGFGLPAPFNTGITGAGMYVGVVDTGLSGAHLDFHTGEQGSPSRVVHTYSSPDLPSQGLSADPLVDEDGHGTHVTGIIAGNGFSSAGIYTGMAPGAEILIGKTSFFTTDIITASQNMILFAETASKPIPVNLSLGVATGPHDGTSGFESGVNSLAAGTAGSKRLIAVAAGNETGANEHFHANLVPFGTTSIPLDLNDVPSASVDIWADGDDKFTVTATLGSEVVSVPSGSTGSTGNRISISNRVDAPPNGSTHILVFFSPLAGGGPATIQLARTRNGGTGIVDAYIEEGEGTFNGATNSGTIIEPANAPAVFAVGSFNTKAGGNAGAVGSISNFSSFGPTRDGRLKPDVTAPGSVIYSARSLNAPISNYIDIVTGNDNYAILQGTSMAAPHVTGIAALVWQSNPALTGAQMRERLRKTADTVPVGGVSPNTTWGFGKVNALAAVRNSVASITAPATATPGSVVSLASDNSSAAFGNPLTSFTWSLVQQPAGSTLSLSSTTPSASFIPIVPGNYTVGLSVSQTTPDPTLPGSATATIHVNNIPSIIPIAGPASSDNLAPVSFHGSGIDLDGQMLAFRWVLVSRPSGSAATLSTANVDNVTLAPDAAGTYEVGLRVDDTLDNSALAVHAFAAGAPAPSPSAGGGGCGISHGKTREGDVSPLATVLIILSPAAGIMIIRRYIMRSSR